MRKDGLVVFAEGPVGSTLNKGRIEVMEFTTHARRIAISPTNTRAEVPQRAQEYVERDTTSIEVLLRRPSAYPRGPRRASLSFC